VTLSQLALTVLLLAALGLAAHLVGVSAIPAYLLTGLLLGPNQPHFTSLITPSEVTDFVAELGLVFLLFFLGLEFSLDRLSRTGRHIGLGGSFDLLANAAIGLVVGIAAFGVSFGALILAAAVYVSSSAITVKGLIDFRRLADEETDLVLGILLFEDLAIAFVLGFAATGGGSSLETLGIVGKALAFIAVSLAVSRWLSRAIDRALDWFPRESFLLFTLGLLVGMAALANELGLSEAIGALMAGVILS
jgi:CPA2 family monovalent cation:H+ antiporter-2